MTKGKVQSKYVAHGDSYTVEAQRGDNYPVIISNLLGNNVYLQLSKESARHLSAVLLEAVDYLNGNFPVQATVNYPKEPGNA